MVSFRIFVFYEAIETIGQKAGQSRDPAVKNKEGDRGRVERNCFRIFATIFPGKICLLSAKLNKQTYFSFRQNFAKIFVSQLSIVKQPFV